MPVYYSTPIYTTPSHYAPPPYYTAAPTGAATYYVPNHHWAGGPQHHSHRWTAGPEPNHQVVTEALAPEVLYSTPRPPAPRYSAAAHPHRRGLLVDTDMSKPPTWNWNHAPSENHVLYSTSVPRPVYDTKYIPSLNWPSLGPHKPLALQRQAQHQAQPGIPAQDPRRKLRIAFNLKTQIERKEGIPLSFLLHETATTLKRRIEKPYQTVLPHNAGGRTASITLRFWVSALRQHCHYYHLWRFGDGESACLPRNVVGSRRSIRTPCRSTSCPWTPRATT